MSSAALGVVSCRFGPCLWSPQESFVDRYSKSFEMNFSRATTRTLTHPNNVSETRARGGWVSWVGKGSGIIEIALPWSFLLDNRVLFA